MGKPNRVVYSPSVAWTMRSAVTALLSFVALPSIPLSSTLDTLIESVKAIVDTSHISRRQELMDFGEHVGKVVNQLVFALRNEEIAQQPSVRNALEELQRTLDKILRKMYCMNSSGSLMYRFRRALFPEEDQMQVIRMRQQLEDALSLFQFTAVCQLLARLQNPSYNQAANTPVPAQRGAQRGGRSPRNTTDNSPSNCLEHVAPHTSQPTQMSSLSVTPNQVHRRDPLQQQRRTRARGMAFVAPAPPSLGNAQLTAACREVDNLRRSFYRCRRPLPAMELAIALGRYSDLLVQSGHAAEALTVSQESASLFKSLAEKGPEIYYQSD